MSRQRSICSSVFLLCALLLLGAGACQAQNNFTLILDTSALVNNANGPFSLDFQLNDGSGTNDGNNAAAVTNFIFGNGSALGNPTTTGGASGSLSSGVAIKDTGFLNDLYQQFKPGNTLTFDVLLSQHSDIGSTPDQFSVAILDGNLNEIPTTGNGALLTADITDQGVTIQTFAGTGAYAGFGPPTITAVPESGYLATLVAGFSGGLFLLRSRKR